MPGDTATKDRIDTTHDSIGIHRMAVVSGGLSITAAELSMGITVGNMRRKVTELLQFNTPHNFDEGTIAEVDKVLLAALARVEGTDKAKNDEVRTYVDNSLRFSRKHAQLFGSLGKATTPEEIRDLGHRLAAQIEGSTGKDLEQMHEMIDLVTGAQKEFKHFGKEEADKIRKSIFTEEVHITKGLGVKEVRLPGFSEGNVTLVANALYKFIKSAMADPEDARRLLEEPIIKVFFATESNSDRSCPDYMYARKIVCSRLLKEDEKKYRPVVDMLARAEVSQETFACVGGMASLNDAIGRIRDSYTPGSALVITADTAVYDPKLAPGAESTQGSAATLMWITRNPALAKLTNGIGSVAFSMPINDFTKFGRESPFVHGKLSTFTYVYVVGNVVVAMEAQVDKLNHKIKFVLCHVPFPKQAEYFAAFEFAHYLKKENPELLKEIEARTGQKEPLGSYTGFINMVATKLQSFNRLGDKRDKDIVDYLSKDKEINAWWDWCGVLRKQPEFGAFIKTLGIDRALKLPSLIGNSYAGSVFVSFASTLKYGLESIQNEYGLLIGYGSGAQSIGRPIEVVATQQAVDDRLIIDIDATPIDHLQYMDLHPALLTGEGMRMTTGEDLVERARVFLRGKRLKPGFHVIRRSQDSTGDYAFVEETNNGASIETLPDQLPEQTFANVAISY